MNRPGFFDKASIADLMLHKYSGFCLSSGLINFDVVQHATVALDFIRAGLRYTRMSLRGDRLRELRLQRGYTQEALAERLELGIRQIHRYEKHLSDPAGNIVAKIALELNTSSDYLLGLTDNPLPIMQTSDISSEEIRLLHAVRAGQYDQAMQLLRDEISRTAGKALTRPEDRRKSTSRRRMHQTLDDRSH